MKRGRETSRRRKRRKASSEMKIKYKIIENKDDLALMISIIITWNSSFQSPRCRLRFSDVQNVWFIFLCLLHCSTSEREDWDGSVGRVGRKREKNDWERWERKKDDKREWEEEVGSDSENEEWVWVRKIVREESGRVRTSEKRRWLGRD
jgi:hypothetical protein